LFMFKRIEIDRENDLEALVMKEPDCLEEGMRILDHQVRGNGKFIDVLGVDADGVLAVIELKLGEEDEMLVQALDYYDWVYSNRDRLKGAYGNKASIQIEEDPRIILVASGFSDRLRRAARHVEPNLTLLEYSYLSTPGNERAVVCREIENQPENEFAAPVSLEGTLSRVADGDLKVLVRQVHSELSSIGKDLEPIPRDGYIRCKCAGRIIGELGLRRTLFYVWWMLASGEWADDEAKVKNLEDWRRANAEVLNGFKERYRALGGS